MAVFTYKANDSSRARVEGTVTADTARQAREDLRQMGLTVREIVPQRRSASGWLQSFRFGGIGSASGEQAANAIRELSTLLGAGIPILQALDTVRLQHKDPMRTTIAIIQDEVRSGNNLADALDHHPLVFDSLVVSMVKVGEATGSLARVLTQLADFKERSLRLKDRVFSSLAYPIFLSVVMVAVTSFLMTVVLPNLLDNLVAMGRELPLPTRIVKSASDFLITYGWIVVFSALVLSVVAATFLRTDRGQWVWYRFLMSLPVIGTMASKQALAKIALILSALLKSGVVFDQAAAITANSTKNPIFREALLDVKTGIGAGQEMAGAFSESSVFPPVMIQIIRVGQESGQLESMLDRLSIDYDQQLENSSARLASLIEPALILMLAVVVGLIMAAVILPILEAGNVV